MGAGLTARLCFCRTTFGEALLGRLHVLDFVAQRARYVFQALCCFLECLDAILPVSPSPEHGTCIHSSAVQHVIRLASPLIVGSTFPGHSDGRGRGGTKHVGQVGLQGAACGFRQSGLCGVNAFDPLVQLGFQSRLDPVKEAAP